MLPPRGLICKPHFLDARREMLAKHGSVWARGDHLRHPASIFLSGTLQAGEAMCEAASSSWRLAFGVQQTLPRHRAVWLYDYTMRLCPVVHETKRAVCT